MGAVWRKRRTRGVKMCVHVIMDCAPHASIYAPVHGHRKRNNHRLSSCTNRDKSAASEYDLSRGQKEVLKDHWMQLSCAHMVCTAINISRKREQVRTAFGTVKWCVSEWRKRCTHRFGNIREKCAHVVRNKEMTDVCEFIQCAQMGYHLLHRTHTHSQTFKQQYCNDMGNILCPFRI